MASGGTVLDLLGVFERETASLEFGKIVAGALRFLHGHLGIDRASVALLREGQEGFRVYDTTLPIAGVESGALLPPNAASLAETVRERRAVYRKDLSAQPATNPVDQKFLAAGLRCTLSVPLVAGGRCLGTLNAAVREADGLSPETMALVELLAPRLAQAIENGLVVDALGRSERQFRTVFERLHDGILVADRATRRLTLVNQAMAAMLGREAGQLLRLAIDDLHPAGELPRVLEAFRALAAGEIASAADIPLLRADGAVFPADVSAASLEMGGRPCVVGVFRDAGERRRREQEMLQAQKMDSIRLLAAGLAHDFNNLLTGILGNLTTARDLVGAGSEAGGLLGESERACAHAARLTRQLLTFAKGGAPVRKVLDLRAAVRDAAGLACAGSDVRCEVEVADAPWAVFADEGQLVQAVQNLVHNAVQASPRGGRVRVALTNAPAAGGGQDQACVTVQDWGCGIAPEALGRVFLPFFTTREHGNGLGLAVAHSIVANHGGRLEVESQLGRGSTFRLWLPARRGDAPPERAAAAEPARGAGRVLVMDDEVLVRTVASAVLSRAGYQVTCVEHGQAAVDEHAAAGARGEPFDLVVLDLTVRGGMGGQEAARRILQASPEARLLVSSGYSDDPVMDDPAGHGLAGVLPKPYSASQLCEAVAAALRAAGR
ncbi:MAG TPA: ATP-binding protein [Myxococcales bacterium]|jgi:PAS domain S-box-containing protein